MTVNGASCMKILSSENGTTDWTSITAPSVTRTSDQRLSSASVMNVTSVLTVESVSSAVLQVRLELFNIRLCI